MSTPEELKAFSEYAQTRTVTGSQAITSLAELRALIEAHGAWGSTLTEFQERAGVRIEGDTAYVTQFYWHADGWGDGMTLQGVWELVQYLHKFYAAR